MLSFEQPATMLTPPEIRDLPAQNTAVVRLTIPRGDMMRRFDPAVREVLAALNAQGIAPAGPVFAHYLKLPGEIFDFELGFPVAQPITAAGNVYPAPQPAQKIIRTVYTGPFEGLSSAWGVFQHHILAKKYRYAVNFREAYLTNPDEIADTTEYKTELIRILVD